MVSTLYEHSHLGFWITNLFPFYRPCTFMNWGHFDLQSNALPLCAPFLTPVHICDYSQVMRIHFSIIQYTIRAKQNESSVRGSV